MMVSLTWFLWLLLYASTNRWLNWSVAERTHIVSWVPSSGLLLLVPPPLSLPHAAAVRARTVATAAAPMRPRRRLCIGAADRSVPVAMSAPSWSSFDRGCHDGE